MSAAPLRRRRAGRRMELLAACALALVLAPVVVLFAWSLRGGLAGGGFDRGLVAALLASLELVGLGLVFGVPLGLLAGLHAAELASLRVARLVRLVADVLSAAPPLLLGVLVHSLVVTAVGVGSALPSALALGLLIAPPVARSTEELLSLVPEGLREAALGLGLPPWRVLLFVSLPSVAPSLGGVVIAVAARALGDAAPLLFTAGASRGLGVAAFSEAPSLALGIYTAFGSADPADEARAFAASALLLALVAVVSASAKRRWGGAR